MAKCDYPVGYGKPPKETQFKKGQSGNRLGRPKGSRNMLTILEDDLSTLIPITVNGRPKKVSKGQGIIMQFTQAALKGNIRAIIALLNLLLNREYRQTLDEAARAEAQAAVRKPDLSLFTVDELMTMSEIAGKVDARQRARLASQMEEPVTKDDAPGPEKSRN